MEDAIKSACGLVSNLSNRYELEVEARIKGPIVRKDTVERLLRHYDMREGVEYVELRNKSSTGAQTIAYRCIDMGNIECKSKLKSYKCPNEWVTIAVSFEVNLGNRDMLVHRHFIETTKTRYSKVLDCVRLDVTHIHTDDIYQVEIEALDHKSDKIAEYVGNVIRVLQDSPLYISRAKFDVVRRIIGGDGYFTSSTMSMNAFGSIEIDRSSDFSIYRGKYQKPIALTKKRLPIIFREKSYMTAKLDGVRRFVVAFNGMAYDIEPEHMHVRLLCNSSPYNEPFPTIIDTELVSGTYNIFDICAFEGWYVGKEKLTSRLSYAKRWVASFEDVINCVLKDYEEISQDDPIAHINNFHRRLFNFPIDGIIFTNEESSYVDNVIKWKEHITIDLTMTKNGELDERIIPNKIDMGDVDIRNDGVYEFEVLGIIEGEDTKLDLKVLRFRDDKKKPNHSNTIINNIDAFELKGIWNGYGCVLMRRYHNATKRKLLKKVCAKGCSILDVGSGQGGDISKWKNAKKVYCIEPDTDAITELKERLSNADMKVKIIQCTLSNAKKICGKVKKIDVLSLFFCANFFTRDDTEGLRTIVDKYRPKHIVGIFLDKKSLRYGKCHPCYEIIPEDDKYHITLFGTRINQREYPIEMDQLYVKGYKLVEYYPLGGDKSMSVNERKLSQMFSLFHLVQC